MREQWSLGEMVASYAGMRRWAGKRDAIDIVRALNGLRRVECLPPAYVDGLQDELLRFIGQPAPESSLTWVYLAFHGLNDRASFLKAGVARDVKKRMRELYTGNPMPRLWTYAAPLDARSLAYRVESALHNHLRETGTSGEWFQVHGLSEVATKMVADSLSEVASLAANRPVTFIRQEC